ncbi:L-proline dehydrogenase [Paenibacillus algorifonticola]|uniref:proline dehydrogenase n=1 Tax=Paenibacillus algorifonticola TaxID=684063 RepID=A0A1I2IYQ0_9BACL|nr:proline dehydrogenase family protein [Paenibacillus algorifonticola]SFF46733.1 L-proline dehydrogenase [Paenibacillus algorifonticola]
MAVMRDMLLYLSKNRIANRMAKRFGLRLGAERFVAGETLAAAMKKVAALNESGLVVTLDHLGEFTRSEQEAKESAEEVVKGLQAIASAGAAANVSVKLTQLGLDISYPLCLSHMRTIVSEAKRLDSFVRIDMEDYAHNEPSIQMYEQLRAEFGDHIGIVLQAYLFKTEADMERLLVLKPNYRLVKGAYKEPPEVAFPDKTDVDRNFIHIIKKQLDNGHYAAVATHDDAIIEWVKGYVKEQAIPVDRFEFQMLYGIRTALQQQLAEEGYKVRTYVPYGTDWYGYFMRRLAERPENVSFVLKSMFKR